MFFIDESGSIPKFEDRRYKNRFFVIGFVHTDDPKKLKRVYKKTIANLHKKFPDFFSGLYDPEEMKGSDALPFMKYYILQQLIQKTDIQFAHMVVDNWEISEGFRKIPSRTFNYLVKLIMKNFRLSAADQQNLKLTIDNRNTAIPSLRSLEEYLYSELVLGEEMTDDVSVDYVESKSNPLIQVADIFANTVYQRFRNNGLSFPQFEQVQDAVAVYPETYECLYRLISPRIVTPFVYPPRTPAYAQTATTRKKH